MLMVILMLWGSGCVLSFRTHLYAFGFWRIMDGAVITCCYRERYHGGFMHGGFVWAFYYGTYHHSRYANRDFSEETEVKRGYFIKTYFNGNIYLLKLLLFGNSFSIRR